jgi:hypothetical protein
MISLIARAMAARSSDLASSDIMSLDMPGIVAAISNKCCPSFYDSIFLDSERPEERSGSPDQKTCCRNDLEAKI